MERSRWLGYYFEVGDSPINEPGPRGEPWSGWVSWTLYAAAAAWPLGVYQQLPAVYEPLSTVALAVLVLLGAADVLRSEQLRLPFELFWPAAVAALMALLPGGPPSAPVVMAALVFVAAVQAAKQPVTVLHCCWLSGIAGGVTAALTLLAPSLRLFPAAFDPLTGFQLPHSASLSGGVFDFLLCLGLACAANASPALPIGMRRASAVAAAILAAALLLLCGSAFEAAAQWRPPVLRDVSPIGMLIFLLLLWLLARVAARRYVSPFESPLRWPLALTVVAAGLYGLALPVTPRAEHGLVLGLVAASTLRGVPAALVPRAVPVMAATLACMLLLLVINNRVVLDNGRDPRNYDQLARAWSARGDHAALLERLTYLGERFQGEARLQWWRAMTVLSLGRPEAAADLFRGSLSAAENKVLPPPTPTELQEFIANVRVHVSGLPPGERGLSYERALVALGEPVQALSSLRLRAEVDRNTGSSASVEASPQAEALAWLLGDRSLAAEVEEMGTEGLGRILRTLGAEEIRGTSGVAGVVVLAARVGPSRFLVGAFGDEGVNVADSVESPLRHTAGPVPRAQWSLAPSPEGPLQGLLMLPAGEMLAQARFAPQFAMEATPPPAEAAPLEPYYVILVLMP